MFLFFSVWWSLLHSAPNSIRTRTQDGKRPIFFGLRGEDHPYVRPIALEIMAALTLSALSPSSDQFYAMLADDEIGLSGRLRSRHLTSLPL